MIPLVDLKAQHRRVAAELEAAAARVLASAQFVLGDEVSAFEEEFAAFSGAALPGVAVNSGTSALHLALLAAGVGPGDEVITVPFTFVATVAAIRWTGARPVFVDVDPESLTMDPRGVEAAISERTRVLLPVHLYGQPADMDPLLDVARRHGLTVVEDAAQAHGAEYRGRRVGAIGDLTCFSFYPSKNLGACGEGGMVLTDDRARSDTIRRLRDWGQEGKGRHVARGFNYRMEGIQAALLRVKLRRLAEWNDERRANAALYEALLSSQGVATPREMPYARHVYHLYVVRTAGRDALRRRLGELGVETGVHYPVPVHRIPAWVDPADPPVELPCAERAAREVLSLPMYPELTPQAIAEVCRAYHACRHGVAA